MTVYQDQALGCVRCLLRPSAGLCCSSHEKALCHGCYRRTHFVELCVPGCEACAAEGLPQGLYERTDTPT